MTIKKFELMHGAVLTRICRNDQPIALTLIESDDQRATYKLNDSVVLYIKYSASPRKNGKLAWCFTFSDKHIEDLAKYTTTSAVYMALVCGSNNLESAKDFHICLLKPEDINACLDLSTANRQTISVESKAGKSLRAYGKPFTHDDDKLVIPQNRLDKWQVPGR